MILSKTIELEKGAIQSISRDRGPSPRWRPEERSIKLMCGGAGTRRIGLPGQEVGRYCTMFIEVRDREYRIEIPAEEAREFAKALLNAAGGESNEQKN